MGPAPSPAGFPRCAACALARLEQPATCLACAVPVPPPPPPPPARPCAACGQGRRPGGRCPTPACQGGRPWSVVWSIGTHEGPLRSVLVEHKYGPDGRWAPVLGRLVVGWLDRHATWVEDLDLLVPVPSWTGPGARRRRDPVGEVAAAVAGLAGPRWDVAAAVAKQGEVPAMVGRSAAGRRAVAEGPLRRALVVPDPPAVAGARVLVLDDVLTGGGTLTEVARALRVAGAEEVAGLVLARPAWRWRRAPDRPARGARRAPT